MFLSNGVYCISEIRTRVLKRSKLQETFCYAQISQSSLKGNDLILTYFLLRALLLLRGAYYGVDVFLLLSSV